MDELTDILTQAISSISSWKVAGALATLALLAGLLVRFSKTAACQTVLGWLKLDGPKRRPWISAALGAIAAGLATLAAGKPWPACLVALVTGALAGWAATGVHESSPSAAANRELGRELAPMNAAEVKTLKDEVRTANVIGDEAKRLAAKAALLDRMIAS